MRGVSDPDETPDRRGLVRQAVRPRAGRSLVRARPGQPDRRPGLHRDVRAALRPRRRGLRRRGPQARPADRAGVPAGGRRAGPGGHRHARTRSGDGWAAYPAGVAWALRRGGPPGRRRRRGDRRRPARGRRALVLGRAGMLGRARADRTLRVAVPRRELAALARRAENDFVGVPSGIMDQIAALRCRAGARRAARLPHRRRGAGPARPGRGRPDLAGHRHRDPARQHRRPLRRTPPRLRTGRVRAGRPVAAGRRRATKT